MKLTGSAALVTGGAGGLGRATATTLRDAGAHAVIADLSSSPGAVVARELSGTGPRASASSPATSPTPTPRRPRWTRRASWAPCASRSAARAWRHPAACSPAAVP
ncbi:SDR family NAD(P)-dependent oxidoreductase [Streptomyces sp. NPDC005760]|uniref:SDR family NAD(P)-dependent oxidoreductase n=1 Tax=Streptomyces sp. NPDC005760 TaxID=3156718 RepID=UPI0034015227